MGRTRELRWGPRVIDLDLLLYDDLILKEGDLIIPHPRMHERMFVLKPLSDIFPDFVHPELRKGIGELIGLLGDEQKIFRVE
jgi:7,8-dihydro-6-hydroxymethylpterin-pyrophosphokinase